MCVDNQASPVQSAYHVEKLVVHVSNKIRALSGSGGRQTSMARALSFCGSASVLAAGDDGGGGSLRIHIACRQRRPSRFIHVQSTTVAERHSGPFGIKLCHVMVYEWSGVLLTNTWSWDMQHTWHRGWALYEQSPKICVAWPQCVWPILKIIYIFGISCL